MDVNEYLKKVTPAAHRSRLAPFWDDITKLRESNCTLDQVREYLKESGVVISVAGLSNYIKRSKAPSPDAAVKAIEYALMTDEGIEFLRCWMDGDFNAIRREWPDAPESVFNGVDPLTVVNNQGEAIGMLAPMAKDNIGGSIRALAFEDEVRSETARLRDVFDDIETALDAGVKVPVVLEALHKQGFKISLAGFRSAIQRIRKERAEACKSTGENQDDAGLIAGAPPPNPLSEFEKQVAPGGKRSRLTPFKEIISELKTKGYANGQIAQFLESKGLKVTAETVRKFLKCGQVKTSHERVGVAADALRAAAKDDANRSKIARLRELFVEIEAAQKAGVTNTRIVETLNTQGFDIKLKTFETMMHRLRKENTQK